MNPEEENNCSNWYVPQDTYTNENEATQAEIYFNSLKPMVTIGLLVYNGGKYLRGAMDSLVTQLFDNYEIIISDNASTDNTQSICQEYARKYNNIRYIRQAKNMGPIYNFKFVLTQARGEYFMWASHDDLWAPNYISECLEVFADNPDCVSVFSHFNVKDLISGNITERNTPTCSSSVFPKVRVKIRLSEMIPNMIYSLHRTDVLKKVIIETIDWFDVFLTVQLSFYGKILIIPHYLYIIGTDGPRKPYSLTGKHIELKPFRHMMSEFLKKNFPLIHRIHLMLYVFYVTFRNERFLNKVIDEWPEK